MLKLIRAGCVSIILFFMPQSLYAALEDSSICDESIARAAQESTVPRAVLMKIARLESGRKVNKEFVSWSWSLNTDRTSTRLHSSHLVRSRMPTPARLKK